MFGNNPVRKRETGDGSLLQVNSIFHTIQGEGPFAGHPATFIRLTGCNLRCHFCDTKWDDAGDIYLTVDEIVTGVRRVTPDSTRLIILTGGEPMRQPLNKLLYALLIDDSRFIVQIETAGTLWQDDNMMLHHPRLSIVCSPKTPVIDQKAWERATAFKYVIRHGETAEDDGLPNVSTQQPGKIARLARPRPGAPVYLSPCDDYDEEANKANRMAVAEIAMKFGYRAGCQLHKYLDVP